jgi:hypothetical protein
MKAIQFPALLDSISTRKDRSLKVILSTQEMNGIDMAELFAYRDTLGYVTFTSAPESHIDVPDLPIDSGTKSPSQRLRNVLYVLWEQKYKAQYPDQDVFYIWYMNRIIEQVKDKLEVEK